MAVHEIHKMQDTKKGKRGKSQNTHIHKLQNAQESINSPELGLNCETMGWLGQESYLRFVPQHSYSAQQWKKLLCTGEDKFSAELSDLPQV